MPTTHRKQEEGDDDDASSSDEEEEEEMLPSKLLPAARAADLHAILDALDGGEHAATECAIIECAASPASNDVQVIYCLKLLLGWPGGELCIAATHARARARCQPLASVHERMCTPAISPVRVLLVCASSFFFFSHLLFGINTCTHVYRRARLKGTGSLLSASFFCFDYGHISTRTLRLIVYSFFLATQFVF